MPEQLLNSSNQKSLQKTARIAGLLYLLSSVTSAFHFIYVRPTVYKPTYGALETANNIIAHQSLFQMGILSLLICQILFLFLGFSLENLFVEVNKERAKHLLIFSIIASTLALLNILTNFGALLLVSKAEYLNAFEQGELNALALLFLKLNNYGQGIVEIFWGLWFFAFGSLIIESKYLPKMIGMAMIAACFAYETNIFIGLFARQYHSPILTVVVMVLGALATFPTIFWLIVKGVSEQSIHPKPEQITS